MFKKPGNGAWIYIYGESLYDAAPTLPRSGLLEVFVGADAWQRRTTQTLGHRPKHLHHTSRPVVASYEPGERWAWCYVDETELSVPEHILPVLRD